jgi:hypothetical protein
MGNPAGRLPGLVGTGPAAQLIRHLAYTHQAGAEDRVRRQRSAREIYRNLTLRPKHPT